MLPAGQAACAERVDGGCAQGGLVDVTDDDAPTRYFYDYCALPPSAL